PSPAQPSPLSLHDALPIYSSSSFLQAEAAVGGHIAALGVLLLQVFLLARHLRLDLQPWRDRGFRVGDRYDQRNLHTTCGLLRYGDRKSTRLNSSHLVISYA